MLSFDSIALPFLEELVMETNVKELRLRTGLPQNKFAIMLGVSIASLRRWETGDASPSPLAANKIKSISCLSDSELFELSNKVAIPAEKFSEDMYATVFEWNGKKHKAQWEPFVINGPSDQKDFYCKLLDLQQQSSIEISENTFFSRLSLLQSVDGVETSQHKMERPKRGAKSWSSDYGTHGFHRYVGRFPSHLIRALLNYFGANHDDTVLDPFCGSGTTLVEARMLGVKGIGIEISPLSAMMSRVKCQFPNNGIQVSSLLTELSDFYIDKWNCFTGGRNIEAISYNEILDREGNEIPSFSNVERWFTQEALLGTSIIVEFIIRKEGYIRDFLTIALSSKMRSIGNVDVDVVRAEYRKEPRKNVDVLKMVTKQIQKMSLAINDTLSACDRTINQSSDICVFEGNVLNTSLPEKSISYIITSPPYGVESLSYLRTHLLSFRALEPVLGVDPYNFGEGIIGSEYLDDALPDIDSFSVSSASNTYNSYFSRLLSAAQSDIDEKRVMMMMRFFEDMYNVIKRFDYWLNDKGKVAFIIGNKRIGDSIIPTDTIITEIFEHFGFVLEDFIAHKLKTNNSNSQVPWQDRIIENEYVLLFRRKNK